MNKDLQTHLEACMRELALLRKALELDKQAASILSASEKRYRSFFDNAPVGLAQVAPDGRFIDVNRRFCQILGYSREELLHHTALDVTHPEDRLSDQKMRQRVLSGEIASATWEKRYVRQNGEAVWAKLTLSAAETKRDMKRDMKRDIAPDMLVAIENISERRSLEESLGRIAFNLARKEGMALGGTWEWNVNTGEVHASPEVLRLFSLPADQVPPTFDMFLDRIHPEDRAAVQEAVRLAIVERKPFHVEYRLTNTEGAQLQVSASGEVYRRNASNEPVLMIGLVQDITTRKQAERALKESELRFRQLFDNAVDGIFIADTDGKYADANRSACAMLQYNHSELIGKSITDLIPERDMERLAQAREYFLKSVENVQVAEWELKRKDGCYIPVEISSRILPDGRWMAIVRNISERKRIQCELERYAEEVQDLYDNAPCGYHSLDRSGLFLQMNKTELRWLGYDAAEVVNRKKFTELVTADGRKKFEKNFPRFLQTGFVRDLEFEMVRKDGTLLPVLLSASAVYDQEGNFIKSRTTLFDMTDLAEAQKKLRQAATVFEHTNDAILITDSASTITAVNNAFSRITGYAPEEVIGKNPRLLKSEWHDDQFYRELWRSLEETGSWQGEIWDTRKSGERFPVWETITAVRDESGKVTDYISIFSDITTIKETERRLAKLAYHDALTGLPNRLLFNDRLAQALAHARRHKTHAALLLLDLDRFKLINDTLGHAAGDKLLQVIASRLKQAIRAEDTVARLGGDEFAIVLAQPDDASDAALLAQKVVSLISQPMQIAGQTLNISASIGIGMYPDDATDPETLAKCADMAMYSAKQKGRNAYAFHTAEMTDVATETLEIDRDLRKAIVLDELELFYQPQVNLSDGKIVGIEALIRWNRPKHGLELPGRFIPVAEESDLIESIGDWVFDKACTQLHCWHTAGLPSMRLAINLCVRQLRKPRFIEDIRNRLAMLCSMDGFRLDLELTETALQTDPDIVNALKELKSMGLQVAIDDFGTGYSSLNSLKHLPVDILKIDRSFISGIPGHADDKAITSAIIAMGHSLGMEVIAEGIETPEQLQFVIEQRCDEAQGFLLKAPMRTKEFERFLASGTSTSLLQTMEYRQANG